MTHQKKYGYKLRDVSSSFSECWAVKDLTIGKEIGTIRNSDAGWVPTLFFKGSLSPCKKRGAAIESLLGNSRISI